MALTINTEFLKLSNNLFIESQLAQQLGSKIFNNLGADTEEYKEYCKELLESCNRLILDAETLKTNIPNH